MEVGRTVQVLERLPERQVPESDTLAEAVVPVWLPLILGDAPGL